MKISPSSSSMVGAVNDYATLHAMLQLLNATPRAHASCSSQPVITVASTCACVRVAAIGYTGKYRQTLLLHSTEPGTTVFAIGCTVVLGKLDDP